MFRRKKCDTFRICHINAILNGVAGIVVFSAPSAVSAAWFPPRERTTATGIALVFNNLGNAASFLMAPHIVEDPSNTTHGPGANFTCPILPLDEIRRIKNQIALLMYVGKFNITYSNRQESFHKLFSKITLKFVI